MHTLLITLLVIVSIALIIVVLLQTSKSAGLSGAISGGAGDFSENRKQGALI